MNKVAASIMCADQLHLKDELQKLEKAGIELLHCDVMDGVFVENLAMGPYVLDEIKKVTSIPLDIHLATVNPSRYIEMFAEVQPEYMSFHMETTKNARKDIELLQKHNIKPVIAISPETSIDQVLPYLSDVSMVLMMTVNPGFAGQDFNYSVLKKVDMLRQHCAKLAYPPLIEVDGNINEKTVPKLVENGANVFVLGTSQLFNEKEETYAEKIANIKNLISKEVQ